MPKLSEVLQASAEAWQRLTPVFLIEDVCYPSEDAKHAQRRAIEAVLKSLRRLASEENRRFAIAELRMGKQLQWTAQEMQTPEDFRYEPPREEPSPVCEEVFFAGAPELYRKLSRKELLCGDLFFAGTKFPCIFFFFNSAEALRAFLAEYRPMWDNKWYREAMKDDRVVLTFQEDCGIVRKRETIVSAYTGEESETTVGTSLADQLLWDDREEAEMMQFSYGQMDEQTADSILRWFFRDTDYAQSADARDAFVRGLHAPCYDPTEDLRFKTVSELIAVGEKVNVGVLSALGFRLRAVRKLNLIFAEAKENRPEQRSRLERELAELLEQEMREGMFRRWRSSHGNHFIELQGSEEACVLVNIDGARVLHYSNEGDKVISDLRWAAEDHLLMFTIRDIPHRETRRGVFHFSNDENEFMLLGEWVPELGAEAENVISNIEPKELADALSGADAEIWDWR